MKTSSVQDNSKAATHAASGASTTLADSPDVNLVAASVDSLRGADDRVVGTSRPRRVGSSIRRMASTGSLDDTVRILRFAAITGLSTVAYLLIYLGLRSGVSAQVANAVALVVAASATTWACGRFVFTVSDRGEDSRQAAQAVLVFAAALFVSAGSLFAANLYDPSPTLLVEVLAMVLANLVATLLRFVLLMDWVLRRSTPEAPNQLTQNSLPSGWYMTT